MKNQDWKLKYSDLKIKFMDAVDVSFRLGMEQGLQMAQVQQAQQASAQAQQAAMNGQPGQDPNADPSSSQDGQMPGQESSDGSELDQHIGALEGLLSGSKPGSPEQAGLQKSLNGLKSFQLTLKKSHDHKISELTLKSIEKAMKPKFSLGKTATKNLSESSKKALSMQEEIVANLMKSMEEEEAKASAAITKTLDFEQILKG